MTLEEMKASYDWQEAWAYASNVPRSQDSSIPQAVEGYKGEVGPVTMDDVAQVIASDDGENDGADWIGVFLLKDGRHLFISAGCDYTGWDCQSGGSSWIADTLDRLVQFGLGENDRSRLKLGGAA